MKIRKSKFLNNVVSLLTGSGISQLIALVSIPILVKYYSPTEFGLYATFIAFASIITILASGRYELAIMLPKNNNESFQIFYLTQIINAAVFIFGYLLIYSSKFVLPYVFNFEVSMLFIFSFFLSVFFLTLNTCLIYLANKYNHFKSISFSRILNSLFVAFFSILFFELGIYGMIIGFIVGNFLSSLNLIIRLLPVVVRPDFIIIKNVFKEYIDLPKKNSFSALFNMASTQLPLILISSLFGLKTAGYYSMSLKFLNAPITFIGKAFSQVFFNKISKMEDNKKYDFYLKTTSLLFIFISPILVALFLCSDFIIVNLIGEEWLYSSTIIKILIPFYIVRFVFSSQSPILITERAFSFDLKFNVVSSIIQVSSVYIIYLLVLEEELIFLSMSISGLFLYVILGYKMGNILRSKKYEKINAESIKPSSNSKELFKS